MIFYVNSLALEHCMSNLNIVCCCKNMHSRCPPPPPPPYTHTATPSLYFTGEATVSEYESLLRSLTYNNTATEPTPGARYVNLTLFDGRHRDITAVIIIVVLVSDNPIVIQATNQRLTFTEGDGALVIGQGSLTLEDADRDPMVTSLDIRLVDVLDAENEFVLIDLSSISGEIVEGLEISVNRTDTLENYQVSL